MAATGSILITLKSIFCCCCKKRRNRGGDETDDTDITVNAPLTCCVWGGTTVEPKIENSPETSIQKTSTHV